MYQKQFGATVEFWKLDTTQYYWAALQGSAVGPGFGRSGFAGRLLLEHHRTPSNLLELTASFAAMWPMKVSFVPGPVPLSLPVRHL